VKVIFKYRKDLQIAERVARDALPAPEWYTRAGPIQPLLCKPSRVMYLLPIEAKAELKVLNNQKVSVENNGKWF
jgi:hypothetical protein